MFRLFVALAIFPVVCTYAQANIHSEAETNVKREFRFFRIQVYNTFHRARPEYDRRRTVGEEALQAWKQAGGQAHQAEVLMQWYRDAKVASLPRSAAALPTLPQFPPAVAVAPQSTASNAHRRPQKPQHEGIYHVREVASRSVTHPENVPGEVKKPKKSSRGSHAVWSSVSRAFLKSLPLGQGQGDDK